jgi:CheY-like chemotaxis protein
MADDDEEDCMLVKEAFEENRLINDLRFVEDGEELMDYLNRRGKYEDPALSPWPDLILLDLNMPKKDGRTALREIKEDPRLHCIPVVILTTSREERDVLLTYNTGASSFIMKPVSFEGLVEVISAIKIYWFDIVRFPAARNGCE